MLPKDKPDYADWSDTELADELVDMDFIIETHQADVVQARRIINRHMELREDILDIIKQRAQKKGWTK